MIIKIYRYWEIELKKTLKGQVENQLNSNDTQNLIDVY